MGELFTTSVLSSQDTKIDNGKEQTEQFKVTFSLRTNFEPTYFMNSFSDSIL